MIKFRTKYDNDTSKYVSPSGDGYMDEYAYKYDDKGVKSLVKTGKTDVWSMVQADRKSCEISALLERFALGDTDVLDRVKGIYGDFTKMPSTMAELYQIMQEGENQFMNLPVELREAFDNSAAQFWSTQGSKESDEKIQAYLDKFVNKQFDNKEEVKDNE